jgi:hypothetical protein
MAPHRFVTGFVRSKNSSSPDEPSASLSPPCFRFLDAADFARAALLHSSASRNTETVRRVCGGSERNVGKGREGV